MYLMQSSSFSDPSFHADGFRRMDLDLKTYFNPA